MAHYITQATVERRLRDAFSALYKLPAEKQTLLDDIAAAEGIVDSWLGRRYAVPITNTAALAVVVPITLDLLAARAYLHASGSEIPDKISTAATTALEQLKAISSGKATLAGATSVPAQETGGAETILVDGAEPVMTRADMEGL